MAQNNNLNNDIFNIILKDALKDFSEEWEGVVDNVFTGYFVNGPEVKPSSKCDRRIKRLIRLTRNDCRHSSHYFPKYVKTAAGLILVAGLGVGATAIQADANGFTLIDWIFNRNTTYTAMELIDTMEHTCSERIFGSGLDWSYYYFPQNLPAGFQITSCTVNSKKCEIQFANDDSVLIFIQVKIGDESERSGPTVHFDTENTNQIQTVKINGYDAYYNKKDKKTTINYSNNDFYFSFTTLNLSKTKAIQLASDLKKVLK